MRHDKGHTIGETACGVSFYNGLPVCAMRERVNRYTVIFHEIRYNKGRVKIFSHFSLQALA